MAASHRDHIQRDGAVERVPLEPGRAGPRLAADHELAAFGTLPVEPEAYQHFWTALEAAGQPPRIVASLDAGTSPKSGGAWPKTRRGARQARPC